jgi:hypothetical protein
VSEANSEGADKLGEGVDLFGAPIAQIRERWGRPSYAKTKENQELVALLAAKNWSQERIARYLGCDPKTLRKHFSRELEQGADLIEAMALQVTLQQMRQGKNPAVTRILEMVDETRTLSAPPSKPKAAKDEPVGKKEQAQRDAVTANEETSRGSLVN